MYKVFTVNEAKKILYNALPEKIPGYDELPLTAALGRVLAEKVISKINVPDFNRSTVDGYAVRAKDTFGASEGMPAYLTITGEVSMGQAAGILLGSCQAVKIATGGMLPEGADSVVMIEYTEELDSKTIGVTRPVAPGENVILKGEDIREGEVLFEAGQKLGPHDLAALAGIGITRVKVVAKPKVGIISTGDEIVSPDEEPGPGQIRDINSYGLFGLVEDAGGEAKLYGITQDTFEGLMAVVKRALEENELVVISGGSSVGARDVTAKVINSLGEPGVLIHGVSVKPGKPTIIGIAREKAVFGLPGHPASAMVIFDLFVRPLLYRMQGMDEDLFFRNPVKAKITRSIASAGGREDYLRVHLKKEKEVLLAEPILGKSGLISTMVRADGLCRIPLNKEGFQAGEEVEVFLFR